MANFYGIDFGTTNSSVVCFQREQHLSRYINIGDSNNNPVPSVVAIDNLTQQISVGRIVRDRIIQYRESGTHTVIESVKSALDTDAVWSTPTRQWDAKAIAAELFLALSKKTEEVTGEPIREAAVAIPIGMSSSKRIVLRAAARSAGIEVLTFVSEPTAAFIAHARDLRHCRFVVVFDWGGGTLDISVLENRGGLIIERYTEGSNEAGDYIDIRLAEWIHTQIAGSRRLNIAFEDVEPRERQILLNQAEHCKRKLQVENVTREGILLGSYAGQHLVEQIVTENDFNDLVRMIVDNALNKLTDCVNRARISPSEIGKLIVVGGTSKLQLLQSELRRRWAQPNILFPAEADWDIARGAAWLAAHPGCYRTAESVGLVLADGEYHAIFPAGTQDHESPFQLDFSLVEDARTAVFEFASQNGGEVTTRHIGELQVKSFGFRDEIIELESRITEDLIFEATANNPAMPAQRQPFSYDKMKWMYEVPAEDM